MENKSPFSQEYAVGNATGVSAPSLPKDLGQLQKEAEETIKKIETDYQLSKPRRKIIRAKIVSK